jgi:multidrug efflux pump subunit AcrA (membrane-fusion protein)
MDMQRKGGRAAAPPDDLLPMLDDRAGFSALELTHSPRRIRRLSRLLTAAFVLLLVGLVFLPWQQFVRGKGRVVAYDPLERSMTVEAPLAGRVQRSFVVEGQHVKEGDVLFELIDNDPNLLANLRQQRNSAEARRQAAERRLSSLAAQFAETERALPLAVEAARTRLDAARVASVTAQQQLERIQGLYKDSRGLASQRDYELALLERDRAVAELERARADLERAEVDVRASLNSIMASRESARADLAAAEQAEMSLDIQVNQTQMQRVVAPRDGVIFRVQATEGTFLKAGSPLCTVIPETANRMVELWLSGNDMPLVRARETDAAGNVVRPGSPVRLQFEGWPAIQFVGWPSAAIGTFGGEVVLVDPTDDGKGRFRTLVAEKPDVIEGVDGVTKTIPWPGDRWLRQGVRANGWILLQRVPLWFEVWRQLNGFPPALSEDLVEAKS